MMQLRPNLIRLSLQALLCSVKFADTANERIGYVLASEPNRRQ